MQLDSTDLRQLKQRIALRSHLAFAEPRRDPAATFTAACNWRETRIRRNCFRMETILEMHRQVARLSPP